LNKIYIDIISLLLMDKIKQVIKITSTNVIKDNIYTLNDYNKLIQEVYEEYIKNNDEELPYFLVNDIVSRMISINFKFNDIPNDINFRNWDKILKIDEININNTDVIIKVPKKSQPIQDQFKMLYDTPQPEQRTKEWFDYRYNRITASDTATAIDCNPYESVESFICKKCDPNFPFLDNDFVFHGKKYEQIATSLYEHLYNSKVTEFGCVPSDKHLFLGASPDGISSLSTLDYKFNKKLGYMLEIKCPYVRPITNKGEIAGDICPYYYYCQVQQQLECCDLEYCDFIQCALVEYEDREAYMKDVNHKFIITEGVDGSLMEVDNTMSKGYLLQFLPKIYEPKFDGDKHHYKSFYIYPPRLNMNEMQYNEWVLTNISNWKTNYPEIADTFYFDKVLYWKINNAHTVTIPRDKEWFNKVFPILKDTWAKVSYYREHLEELPAIQEIADKRKAFYRYKTDFTVNNFEQNTDFLHDAKFKKPAAKPKYTKKYTSNTKSSETKKPYVKKTQSNDCEFVDD
jgi:putative phage-type endonuclease